MNPAASRFNQRVLALAVLLVPLGCSRASSPAPAAGTSAASASAPGASEPPPVAPGAAPTAVTPPSESAKPAAAANPWTTPGDCSVYDRSPDYAALPPEDRARSRSTCETTEEFRAFAASRQACTAASDCAIVSGSCPFGCYVPVAKASAPEVSAKLESLGARLDKAGNRCVYKCMQPPTAECVDKRCVEGPH